MAKSVLQSVLVKLTLKPVTIFENPDGHKVKVSNGVNILI